MTKTEQLNELKQIAQYVRLYNENNYQYNIFNEFINIGNLLLAWRMLFGNYNSSFYWAKHTSLKQEEIEKLAGGVKLTWHDNGQLQSRIETKKGKLHGICETWYPNGQTESYSEWKLNKKNGVDKKWYENGKMLYYAQFIDNKKHSDERAWYDNGQLQRYTQWANNKRHGENIQYYANGVIYIHELWKNGEFIKNLLAEPKE